MIFFSPGSRRRISWQRRVASIVTDAVSEFEIGVSHYFFNDSLLSSHFHHFRGGFWGLDWPFGGSGGVGPFGVSDTG